MSISTREAREIAEARRLHYGIDRAEFRLSDDPTLVPADLGEYDFVVFNALLEHLLPGEREVVIPAVWSHVQPGGLLFVAETPHRYAPIETHTTGGLPFVNYLPPALALQPRRFSNRIEPGVTWQQLLRRGMRGGTEGEFMRHLSRAGYVDAIIERPSKLGAARRVRPLVRDLSRQRGAVQPCSEQVFRGLRRISGVSFTPSFVCGRKQPSAVDETSREVPGPVGMTYAGAEQTPVSRAWRPHGYGGPLEYRLAKLERRGISRAPG